jgi:hypothetical protein
MENVKYKVVKIYRKNGRRIILASNLTLLQAKEIVNSFPNEEKSMVCFFRQV